MVIIKINGGLGNQIFQYVYGLGLAKRNNTDLWCDVSEYKKPNAFRQLELRQLFPGQIKHSAVMNTLKYIRKVKEKQFNFEHRLYELGDYHYVEGFFQSEKYFDNIKNEMKSLFKSDHFDYIRKMVEETGADTCTCIRRKDYLTTLLYYILPEEYYLKAFKLIESKKIVIFTDDYDYVFNKHKNDKNIIVWKNIDSVHDMAAMSFFPKIVMANSTFTWWAAYNSNAEVICPRQYFASTVKWNLDDFYLKEWRQI